MIVGIVTRIIKKGIGNNIFNNIIGISESREM